MTEEESKISIVLKENQITSWKRCQFDKSKRFQIFTRKDLNKEQVRILVQADEMLFKKRGLHLGETIAFIKSVEVKGKRFNLPKEILNIDDPNALWYGHIAGYNIYKKRFVIARYYRSSPHPQHRILPSIRFIMSLDESKELVRRNISNNHYRKGENGKDEKKSTSTKNH